MSDSPDYTFDPVQVDPAGSRDVILDLFGQCARFWRANEHYDVGETVRPARPTGFAYQCVRAGTSGWREPVWNRVLHEQLATDDGYAQWMCVPAEGAGVEQLSALLAASDPIGLMFTALAIDEFTKISVVYSAPGSRVGDTFDAVFSFNVGDVPRVARQRVVINKQ